MRYLKVLKNVGACIFGGLMAVNAHAVLILPTLSPPCGLGDVTLGGSASDECFGYYDFGSVQDTESNNGKLNGNSPEHETAVLNTAMSATDWEFVYKVDSEANTPGSIINGIEITLLSVDLTGTVGSWKFGWADTNGTDFANLPVTIDIAAGFKASTSIAYYIFEQELLTEGAFMREGTFDLQVSNGLSHESLFVRNMSDIPPNADEPPPDVPVPVPGTVILVSVGLLSLRMSRKFR